MCPEIVPSSRNVVCGRSEDGGHSEAAIRMSEQLRLVIRRPNDSGSGSEEEKMSTIALSHKAAKLMKLCDLEGYRRLHDLLRASTTDSLCPAICMTEGCDYTTEMEPDQDRRFCEVCGGQTVTSALVLAGLI